MNTMNTKDRTYIAIDLKSFYASVECAERGLDALTTNLVVADPSRTEKTICLAVSPSLKALGISGRARLFEVVERVREVNILRRQKAPGGKFTGSSCDAEELAADPSLELSYITAVPQMSHYMTCSSEIYKIYLRYIAPEDMHVYSIDEVFIDATDYLKTYHMTAHELAMTMIHDVLSVTAITATVGIGTNLYLAKVAMDIEAKHMPPDKDGVRIAELNERTYRERLWTHTPITDFWRVGRGYARRLAEAGMTTMGDVARCSIGGKGDFYNEDLLYRLFGVNAELLIDHAWGYEPTLISDIKAYQPEDQSLSQSQVLSCPYEHEKARLVLREMAELLSLDLVDKKLVTDQIVVTVGYDIENLQDPIRRRAYRGPVTRDFYGREVPKHAHGTANLKQPVSSLRLITEAALSVFDRETDKSLLIRRIGLGANHVTGEEDISPKETYEQLDLFTDYAQKEEEARAEEEQLEKEKRLQKAALAIKKKYGKNAILMGSSLEEGATMRTRNEQIGGHKA